jgi:hypothetical protein
MSETNDNNFGELKRLLKLKQHEVPPPGYFNHFSGDVMSRIRAGETGSAKGFLAGFEDSWLTNLLQVFQARPGVIGGFATSLCLLLLIGVVMADRPDGASPAEDMTAAQSAPVDNQNLAMTVPLIPAGTSGISISTNAIRGLQPVALFGASQNPLFQPASFMPSGQ